VAAYDVKYLVFFKNTPVAIDYSALGKHISAALGSHKKVKEKV
jgi:hypothetical protein